MIHNDVHEKLVEIASHQGWNENSQLLTLCGFVQRMVKENPDVMRQWEQFLNDIAEKENRLFAEIKKDFVASKKDT